jgi:P27 family predicted phage terminase small subunit
MAGRKPKPVQIKELTGNPGKRALPELPNILPGEPQAPASVLADSAALAEWKRISPQLMRVNLLSEVDMGALAAYCQAFSLWQKASESVEQDGILLTGPMGTRKNPAVGIMLDAWKAVRAFCAEFGLTPSSRSKVTHTTNSADADAFERFLFDPPEDGDEPPLPHIGPPYKQ